MTISDLLNKTYDGIISAIPASILSINDPFGTQKSTLMLINKDLKRPTITQEEVDKHSKHLTNIHEECKSNLLTDCIKGTGILILSAAISALSLIFVEVIITVIALSLILNIVKDTYHTIRNKEPISQLVEKVALHILTHAVTILLVTVLSAMTLGTGVGGALAIFTLLETNRTRSQQDAFALIHESKDAIDNLSFSPLETAKITSVHTIQTANTHEANVSHGEQDTIDALEKNNSRKELLTKTAKKKAAQEITNTNNEEESDASRQRFN